MVLTDTADAVRRDARYATWCDDLALGRTFHYQADAHRSADFMRRYGPISARNYAGVLGAVARFTSQHPSDWKTAVADAILSKIRSAFTDHQVMAGIAEELAKFVAAGWHDFQTSTGPEAGRPSQHVHRLTEGQLVLLSLLAQEIASNLSLGSVAGIGWCLRRYIDEIGFDVDRLMFPNMAAKLSAE